MTDNNINTRSLTDVARELAPNLRVMSCSQPVPSLRAHNVVGVAHDADTARQAVLALERLEYDDGKLGTVVMGRPEHEARPTAPNADPEGVTRDLAPHVLIGGLIGAVVGFLLAGGLALLFDADGATAAGAGVGGLVMFAVIGAIWATFPRMGGSDAYRQTFVDADVTDLAIVSVHTDDADEARAARQALADGSDMQVLDLDRDGRRVSNGR